MTGRGGGPPFPSDEGMYFDQEHGLWLPRKPGAPSVSPPEQHKSEAAEQEDPEHLSALAGSGALAVIICAGLSVAIGLITSESLPGRLSELLATTPILFFEYIARSLASRKFTLPGSVADIFRGRIWYLAAPGYAALVNVVLDVAYAFVRAISGSVTLLALLDIVIGVAMGILIGRFKAPHPVWTVVATGYSASLLGGLLDVLILGSNRFEAIHDGGSLGAVIMLNGAVFAGAGLAGFAGRAGFAAFRGQEHDAPKSATSRISAGNLAGALVMLILAIGSFWAIVSLASTSQSSGQLYQVNRPLSSANGIVITLAQIKIASNGRAEFFLTYTNTGSSAVTLGCDGYSSPSAGLVTLSGGQRIRSVSTSCSADPSRQVTLASGQSFRSYCWFPSGSGLTRQFTFTWSAGALWGQLPLKI